MQWNRDSWSAIRFRPRVLVPVEKIDLTTTLFGCKIGAPFFIAPAGGGKLAHPSGEVLMTKAAAPRNILHWVRADSNLEERAPWLSILGVQYGWIDEGGDCRCA